MSLNWYKLFFCIANNMNEAHFKGSNIQACFFFGYKNKDLFGNTMIRLKGISQMTCLLHFVSEENTKSIARRRSAIRFLFG